MNPLRRPKGAVRPKKRVGRGQGSGLSCTAGRGNKGQNSRSGGSLRPGFEGGQMPLYRRIARRGFSNYPFKREMLVLNLETINEKYASGETLSALTLLEKGLIKRSTRHNRIKILARGEITKKLTVKDIVLSASARAKIEEAGGSVNGEEEDNGE